MRTSLSSVADEHAVNSSDSISADCVDTPIFIDINAVVEAASDTICNSGLDIGTVVVEIDDSKDVEERQIERFLSQGCKCKLNNGIPCCTLFTSSQLLADRDECRQLIHDQLDLVIKRQLRSLCQTDSTTQKSKARNVEHQHAATLFRFGGHRICIQYVSGFLHIVSHKRFNAIKLSWMEKGLSPQVISKVLPHNTTKLSDIKSVVRFILQYAKDHAILLPGRIPGYKRDDLRTTSSIFNNKL